LNIGVLYRFEGLPSCNTENYEKTIFTAILQRFKLLCNTNCSTTSPTDK